MSNALNTDWKCRLCKGSIPHASVLFKGTLVQPTNRELAGQVKVSECA